MRRYAIRWCWCIHFNTLKSRVKKKREAFLGKGLSSKRKSHKSMRCAREEDDVLAACLHFTRLPEMCALNGGRTAFARGQQTGMAAV